MTLIAAKSSTIFTNLLLILSDRGNQSNELKDAKKISTKLKGNCRVKWHFCVSLSQCVTPFSLHTVNRTWKFQFYTSKKTKTKKKHQKLTDPADDEEV